jgi:hypothetical protein
MVACACPPPDVVVLLLALARARAPIPFSSPSLLHHHHTPQPYRFFGRMTAAHRVLSDAYYQQQRCTRLPLTFACCRWPPSALASMRRKPAFTRTLTRWPTGPCSAARRHHSRPSTPITGRSVSLLTWFVAHWISRTSTFRNRSYTFRFGMPKSPM